MQKHILFYIFFLYLANGHIIFSQKRIKFFLKLCVKILFCRHYFSPLNTSMRKGKDPEPDSVPYLWLMDPDPGGPKTSGSCGSGSGFLSRPTTREKNYQAKRSPPFPQPTWAKTTNCPPTVQSTLQYVSQIVRKKIKTKVIIHFLWYRNFGDQ